MRDSYNGGLFQTKVHYYDVHAAGATADHPTSCLNVSLRASCGFMSMQPCIRKCPAMPHHIQYQVERCQKLSSESLSSYSQLSSLSPLSKLIDSRARMAEIYYEPSGCNCAGTCLISYQFSELSFTRTKERITPKPTLTPRQTKPSSLLLKARL